MTPRRVFGSLPLLLIALWGLPILGDLWQKAGEYHGEPYSYKWMQLGQVIVLTILTVGPWIGATLLVWWPHKLTPLEREAIAYEAARKRINDAYVEVMRKIAEEAKRRGL